VAGAVGYEFTRQDAERAMLRFPANEGHVATALTDLAHYLTTEGSSPGLVDDVRIVLAEILNNVEEHAYAGQPGHPVTVRLEFGGDSLRCAVEDRGRGFPAARLPDPAMPAGNPAAPETLPEGGFGWPLVRKLTRDVAYMRDGGTNRLVFSLTARPASTDTQHGMDNGA
jgi:serine/threonine-protein kinase RsbW